MPLPNGTMGVPRNPLVYSPFTEGFSKQGNPLPPAGSYLLLETGFNILLEDGGRILLENSVVFFGNLILQDGGEFLLEDGGNLELDS